MANANPNPFHITLDIPQFFGNQYDNINDWFDRIEDTIRPLAADDNELNQRLVSLLPQKLGGNAYKFYRSLTNAEKADYDLCKTRLGAVFNNQDFLKIFQESLTARPRAKGENIEVYVSELRTLVAQAFPTYTNAQRESEILRRLIAGVSPFLRLKCREFSADNVRDAIRVCKNAERAMAEYQSSDLSVNDVYGAPVAQAAPAPVATVAHVEATDDTANTDKVLEMVLAELKKLSAGTPNAQALIQELRRQNDATQRLINQMKGEDSPRYSRAPYRENRYNSDNGSNNVRMRQDSRDRFRDRSFNPRRNRSMSNDRSGSSNYSRSNSNNRFRNGNNQQGQRFNERPYNDQRRPVRERSSSGDRRGIATRDSPYPSRSPSLSRGNSPRRVTFEDQGNSR